MASGTSNCRANLALSCSSGLAIEMRGTSVLVTWEPDALALFETQRLGIYGNKHISLRFIATSVHHFDGGILLMQWTRC